MGRQSGPLEQVEDQTGCRERIPGHVQAGERSQLRRAVEAHARVLGRLPRARGHAVDAARRDAQRRHAVVVATGFQEYWERHNVARRHRPPRPEDAEIKCRRPPRLHREPGPGPFRRALPL